MFKKRLILAGATVFLFTGCGKKTPPTGQDTKIPSVTETAAALAAVASHLGFASRVPKDADMYFSGYHADELLKSIMESISNKDAPITDEVKFQEALPYVGDEAFIFVGPGIGSQFKMVGETYRELSSMWGGLMARGMLDTLANKNSKPDLSKLTAALPEGFLDQWLNVIEKDSRLRIPSVVMGWKPSKDKVGECLQKLEEGLESQFKSDSGAKPVSFEASGVKLVGYDISGQEVFGQAIDEARVKLKESADTEELLKQIKPESIERLFVAMESMRLTIAAGVVADRVVIYLGNGQEGFKLAEKPEDSIAASDELKWTAEFSDKKITAIAYLSESVITSVLPWLDSSVYWESLAKVVGPEVKDENFLRGLLMDIADTDRELAKRDASAWSAIFFEDNGWRYESSGGWPDPSLDYETPLRMTDAALAVKPAIRVQWVQSRKRNDHSWKYLENYGLLIDTLIQEFSASGSDRLAMIPKGVLPRIVKEMRAINHAYRDEFRAGIGDEVAVLADFLGDIPTIPGISEEILKNEKAPRFIIARPVTDRTKLDAAGKSFASSWRGLTAWASELSGENIPLIQPQSLESNDLVTWYPPLPFIGGDFVPGVTLSDDVWMLGTSRSMVGDFSKYLKNSNPAGETGMIVEIEFAPVRKWFASLYQLGKAEAEALAEEAPEEVQRLANEENLKRMSSAADRIQGLGYRKWMAGGKPRTSLHLRFNPR